MSKDDKPEKQGVGKAIGLGVPTRTTRRVMRSARTESELPRRRPPLWPLQSALPEVDALGSRKPRGISDAGLRGRHLEKLRTDAAEAALSETSPPTRPSASCSTGWLGTRVRKIVKKAIQKTAGGKLAGAGRPATGRDPARRSVFPRRLFPLSMNGPRNKTTNRLAPKPSAGLSNWA